MLYRLLALLIVLIPFPAVAQDAISEEEGEHEIICITVATLWSGSNADIQSIEAIPVPETFRRQFESTAQCNTLVPESLITWQLRFGSEQSVTEALAYLEKGYLRDRPSAERYAGELRRAWQSAQPDLRQALELSNANDGRYSPRDRFIRQSGRIGKLQSLANSAYRDFRSLAEQYLRAAEQHRSRELLEESERYLAAVKAAAEFMVSVKDTPLAEPIDIDIDSFLTDGIEMRAAVLRARLIRDDAAVDRAEEILRTNERSYYRSFAEYAFSEGEDFCDISRGAPGGEGLRVACDTDEDTLHERVVNYLVARATLDFVSSDETALQWRGNYRAIMRLLEAERYFERSRCCWSLSADEMEFRLHMARAEYGLNAIDSLEIEFRDLDVLDELREAEQVALPYEAPSRFRQLAHAWLALHRHLLDGLDDEDQARPIDLRYEAYLRRTLADLDAIAAGQAD